MPEHMRRELDKLNRSALDMCAHVEQSVADAAKALLELDPGLADRVIAGDERIDRMEMDLSENCLKALALYQPVAGDLRFVFSLAKISGILERVGDLAENLARKCRTLSGLSPVAMPAQIGEMSELARRMLKDSIDSLVERDASKARQVIREDSEVNRRKREVRKIAEAAIQAGPAATRQWLTVIAASRNLERIADSAANIAAEVVYSIEGRFIRHGLDPE